MNLQNHQRIKIKQLTEFTELLGFETRNKYLIRSDDNTSIGYAAEQGKGLLGLLFRSYFGHWRKFEIHFFDNQKVLLFKAIHPFRWFFQCLEIYDENNKFLGRLEQRWGILTKKFDLHDSSDNVIATMRSGFFRIWSFPIKKNGAQYALISKKWSGLLKELFLDADSFLLEFQDPAISEDIKKVLLASAVFVDLQYFEKKATNYIGSFVRCILVISKYWFCN